jgi:hypothetical protein
MPHWRLLFTMLMLAFAGSAAAQPQGDSRVPDLSGNWLGRPPFMSISATDPGGQKPGNEDDISYTPAGRARLAAEIPPAGPFGQPDRTTDPWIRYCEPNGPVRIFVHPARTMFVPLPDKVLILHEVMQQFRIVRLNSTHPPLDDLDPTYWGDAIGWYENGDTLVVDIIGLNGRTLLDSAGHPASERAHIVERYKKLNPDQLSYEVLIDDPGSYTKPVTVKRTLQRSNVPFMQSPWNCSTRDNSTYFDTSLGTARE